MGLKKIKFRYFGVVRQKKEKNRWRGQGWLDVISWIDIVERQDLEMKTIKIGDTNARIEDIQFSEQDNIWFLRFMKLRDDDIPSIAKESCAATSIELKDDESLGENLCMLYDNDKGIAMIQSASNSLGISKLEKLFTKIWNIENERIKIKPILDKDSLEKIGRKRCKVVEVGFANIEQDLSDGHNSLGRLLNIYRTMQGTSGKIRISIGRSKQDGTLNINEVQSLLGEALEESCVTSAKMQIKEDDEDKWINLFDEICHVVIELQLQERKPMDFSVITGRMLAYYLREKDYLNSLIHPVSI